MLGLEGAYVNQVSDRTTRSSVTNQLVHQAHICNQHGDTRSKCLVNGGQ